MPGLTTWVPSPEVRVSWFEGFAVFHAEINAEIVDEPSPTSVTFPAVPVLLAVIVTEVTAPTGMPV